MAHNHESAQAGTRTVLVELAVAAIIFALGALVAYDSYRLGSSWASDGPQSGYFPFYIGLFTCICGAAVIARWMAPNLYCMGDDLDYERARNALDKAILRLQVASRARAR